MEIAFPFLINRQGLIASTDYDRHIYEMIEQLIFTAQGERVNRPHFGCGLDRLVFGAVGNEVITATQSLVQSELQQWLGDLIRVEMVTVEMEESTLKVTIRYMVIATGNSRVDEFRM